MPRPASPALAVALALAPLSLAFSPACAGPGTPVTVVSVGDGDTIRVRMNGQLTTVRLACIDAPETAQRPDGRQARRHLPGCFLGSG
jgi:endonuclease YncB( thermonuclease family)